MNMTKQSRHLALCLSLSVTLLAAAAPQSPAPAKPSTPRPNILVVLSDDHSHPFLGCYGNPDIKTPNLDRFASQGIRFDRAYVGTPQCVPSRATFMTGRSAVAINMTRFSAPLPRDVVIYPEILRAAGYFTGVAGRTYHLDGSNMPPETKSVVDANHLVTFPDRLDFVKVSGNRPVILQQYREFLDAVPKEKPFCLQLCYSDPHRPYDRDAVNPPYDPARLTLPAHYPDTPGVRQDYADYLGEISRFDSDFGDVLAELEKRGLADNTLVFFFGDNGGAQPRGKGTLYELGIHVPMLVRWPSAVKAGQTTDTLVSGEDLAPTVLAAAGLEAPASMTGHNLLPLLLGQPYEPRTHVFAQRGAHGSGLPNGSNAFDLGRTIVTPTHKLIYTATWQLPYAPVDFDNMPFWKEVRALADAGQLPPEVVQRYFSPSRPMFELYDLKADPNEFHNLIGTPDAAEIEHDLKALLQERMILDRDFVPLPVPPSAGAASKKAAANQPSGKKAARKKAATAQP
jgi:arylsulfatase A-like enzyme